MKKVLCAVMVLMMAMTCMTGCLVKEGLDGDTVVATVNGVEVTADFYGFYLTQMKKQIEAEMNSNNVEDFWDTAELEGKKLIETAREKALDEVVNNIVIEQKAAENKIKITKDEENSINQQITSMVAQLGSRDKYNEWLAEQGLTDEVYRRFMKANYLSQKLMDSNVGGATDEELLEYYNKNIARVKHILVMNVDENNAPLSDEENAEKRKQAEELLKRAKDGEDFDALVAEYSEDPGSKSQPDGYYLGEGFILGSQGSMVPEFESASLALEVGGVSDIVETSYGYHIIKRYENEQSMFEQNKDQLVSYTKSDKFMEMLEEWKASAKVDVKNDLIEKL